MKCKSILLSALFLTCGLTATAQVADTTGINPHTAVKQPRVLPRLTTKIHLQTRAYGDSIVLRWATEDFVSYNYLARLGVNVLRVPRGMVGDTLDVPEFRIDTMAYELLPLTLEQFRKKYAPTDSSAYIAMGLLYGDKENVHKAGEGFASETQNRSDDQDISYGFAMLVADWRKDLATDMAVRFTDKDVEPGRIYDYYVQPTVWENGGKLIFEPGVAEGVANVPYVPEPYLPHMKDSVASNHSVQLGWWDGLHSSFEVERRQSADLKGQAVDDTWQRITRKPYVPMVQQPEGEDYCLVVDSVPQLGLWNYRIFGYDPFGELTEPAERSIMVMDLDPPTPANLKYIVIERPDDNDLMSKVIAHVVWEKDSIEEDMAGYRIFYKPMRDNGNGWQAMNFDLIAPQDTLFSIDMTGKRTGMMYISAYDETGNESKSFMQQIRLTDYKAPAVPDNFRAEVRKIDIETDTAVLRTKWAYVDLYWQPKAEDDDIDYFDIAFANDSTHEFLVRNEGGIRQSAYTDSLSLNANQKYIYYKVRAIDQSTNIGDWSDWIQVERPHMTPPTQPHLGESSHSNEHGMHMEWVVGADADMKEHVLYRRLGEDGEEEVLARYDADSVKAHNNIIIVDDNPPYVQRGRYYYWMSSENASPFISHSMAVSWKHQGPRFIAVDTKLEGTFRSDEKAVALGWGLDPTSLPEGDWYWAIFRKAPGSDKFVYYMSAEQNARTYTDHSLSAGESASYYIRLQFEDGRFSPNSNEVTITYQEQPTNP
ncbi:MAG: hypothetical protein J6W75_12460 [Bacteroidaceae bacterium]|nr:hypothetical protein [Bacteroidaceae bacterium]